MQRRGDPARIKWDLTTDRHSYAPIRSTLYKTEMGIVNDFSVEW